MNINPFIHEAATNIDENLLYEMFIDNNHSRILNTNKNIFLIGYRGSGKSMLMKYYSFPIQIKHNYNKAKNFENIAIYISCMTPLFMRNDYYLNENEFQASIIAEHLLVLSIAERLFNTLIKNENTIFTKEELILVQDELEFYFDVTLSNSDVLKSFHKWLRKSLINAQKHLDLSPEKFIKDVQTYSSLIIPIIQILKDIPILKDTHFMFMIDDAQMLDKFQQLSLNSWISFRDTSNISFKVALTSIDEYTFITTQENIILENHDYITINLERDFFTGKSDFGDFAKQIIEKRLELFQIKNCKVNDFFPESLSFKDSISEIKDNFIKGIYPERKEWTEEQRKKNASKFIRSIYFRLNLENSKANNVTLAYTGFNTLTNISTGVVRNLLVPCSLMYEKEIDKNLSKKVLIDKISIETQYQTLIQESQKAWLRIDELSVKIIDCTEEHTKRLKNILENFANYLKEKLLDPESTEKKILSFTVHDLSNSKLKDEIQEVLKIGIQGGFIYTRIGPDHQGGRTIWYTPNRMLWPSLGLDPVGENGRKNFPSKIFYKMMTITNFKNDQDSIPNGYTQGELDL